MVGSSGFVVTSRPPKATPVPQPVVLSTKPLPEPASGQLTDWIQVDVTPIQDKGKQRETSGDDHDVKESDLVKLAYDAKGRRMVNQYVRLKEIGKGAHGRVWLCEETNPETGEHVGFCAMKELFRESRERNLRKAQYAVHGKGISDHPRYNAPTTPRLATEDRIPQQPGQPLVRPTNGVRPVLDKLQFDDGRFMDAQDFQSAPSSASTQRDVFVPPTARPRRSALHMDDKVRQEIAIMKRCNHKHVVKLKEVINDPQSKKIFIALEYMAGGQIIFHEGPSEGSPAMAVDQARQTFRDVLLGLEYLHYNGIIHRDIKPANLLYTDRSKTCVKISDFGVSYLSDALARSEADDAAISAKTEQALKKTEGSPAFMAPELCYSSDATPDATPTEGHRLANGFFDGDELYDERPSYLKRASARSVATISKANLTPSELVKQRKKGQAPPIGKAIDVWALGVTLYCMLFGRMPFHAVNEYALYNVISHQEVSIPERMGLDNVAMESEEGRETIDLLGKLLEKDPTKRITLTETKKHPWVLRNLANPEGWLASTNPAQEAALTVSTEEVIHATAPRFASRATQGGFRDSLKRAVARFGTVVGRPRRRSASSTSVFSTFPDNGTDSPVSTSRNPSRQPSMQGTPAKASTDGLGRQWSLKSKLNARKSSVASQTHHAELLSHQRGGLTRTLSNSSTHTSPSSPSFSRRPSTANAAGQLPLPREPLNNLRRQSSAAESDPGVLRGRGASEMERRFSVKKVWNRFKSGSQTPNTTHSSPTSRTIHLDERPFETDDSASINSLTGNDALEAAAQAIDRSAFDQFGRRRRDTQAPVLDDLDFDSDDSLSSLDDEYQGDEWNDGHGWQYGYRHAGSDEDEGGDEPVPTPSFTDDISISPTGLSTSHDSQSEVDSNEHAIGSGSDADVEVDDDDRLEVNFGRSRRQTNASEA